jgi:hypothetical protein
MTKIDIQIIAWRIGLASSPLMILLLVKLIQHAAA